MHNDLCRIERKKSKEKHRPFILGPEEYSILNDNWQPLGRNKRPEYKLSSFRKDEDGTCWDDPDIDSAKGFCNIGQSEETQDET